MSNPKLYVGVDPGGTTGVASCQIDQEPHYFDAFQETPEHVLNWTWDVMRSWGRSCIIHCESYTITARTTKLSRQYDALYVIGALRWQAQHWGAMFKLQDPAVAKKMASNSLLRKRDFWTPAKEHANDAARHMVVALVEAGHGSIVLDG